MFNIHSFNQMKTRQMKTRKLFLIALACAGMSACTNDDVEVSGGTQQVFEGDKAYMCVRISDVGSQTRATAGLLEYGTAAEHEVADAHFYFYDSTGTFVAEGTVTNATWSEGMGNQNSPTGESNNIEWESNTVVVLQGLTHKAYPNYMVTVLNEPSGFNPPETLEEMEKTLASETELSIMQGDNTKFTMSTTSYGNSLPYYFVTPVDEENFSLEPISDPLNEENAITVYVERLAAKVTLDVASTLEEASVQWATDNEKVYKISQNIIYDNNDTEPTDVYIKIEGWTLNAIAKRSNIVKNIDTEWTKESLGFDWDDPNNYRSYWGMSWNYGKGTYPTSSENNTADYEADAEAALSEYLTYVNLKTPTALGSSEYCGENTTTAGSGGIIQSANSSAITSILVKATACDADGNGLDLVRYDGQFYTKDHYIAYVLNRLNNDSAAGNLNVYVKTADESGGSVYVQIDATYVDLINLVDGYVKIALKDEYKSTTFYSLNDERADMESELTYDGVNTYFDSNFNETFAKDANGYNGGQMYYNIPIEHLNNTQGTTDASTGHVIPLEANYGVVRNHHYVVTITDIANLGTGIFDPDEVIVPNDETTYYLTSKINILSWKLVSQSVDL